MTLFPILMFGYMVNNFLPGRLGEVAKSVVISRQFGISVTSTFGTVAVERFSDLFGLLSVLLVVATILPMAQQAIPAVIGITVGGAVAGWLFVVYLNRRLASRSPSQTIGRFEQLFVNLAEGFKSLKSPWMAGVVIGLSIAVWWIEVGALWVLSQSFDLSLNIREAAATLSGIAAGVAVPASPGYVGTFEFAGKEALRLLGREETVSMAFVTFLHLFQVILSTVLGLPVFFRNRNIKGVLQQANANR